MRRGLFVFALLLGALFFHPAAAKAGMHFCNKTSNTVNVAMATDEDFGFTSHVWGWWQVEPNGCKTPIGADLDTTGDTAYYYYGYDTAGGTWSGSESFCINPNYAFDFNDDQDIACDTGTHRRFKEIDTNHNSDFTVNLTD